MAKGNTKRSTAASSGATSRNTAAASAARPAAVARPSRGMFVAGGLLVTMGLTSGVLLALAPQPLEAPLSRVLLASEPTSSLNLVFATPTPVKADRWAAIYVHAGPTDANAPAVEHFAIADGTVDPDGQVQVGRRWDRQQSALPPAGTTGIRDDVISIRLQGDFSHTAPSALQLQRLTSLLSALQQELRLSPQQVHFAELGRFFPADTVRTAMAQ